MEVWACFRPVFFFFFLVHVLWKCWHRAKNRIRDTVRSDLGTTTLKTSRKVVLDNPSVYVSVCVLLSLFPRTLMGVRLNQSSWIFTGMLGYMGHCVVPSFEAIRQPVDKIN